MARTDTRYAVTVRRSDRDNPDLFSIRGPRKGIEKFMRDMLGDRLVYILHIAGPYPVDVELPPEADPYGVTTAENVKREQTKSDMVRAYAEKHGIPIVDVGLVDVHALAAGGSLNPNILTLDELAEAVAKARKESPIGGGTVVYLSEPELDYIPVVNPVLERDEDGAVFLLHKGETYKTAFPHLGEDDVTATLAQMGEAMLARLDSDQLKLAFRLTMLRDLPVYVLADAIRDRGLPVCIFTPEDLVQTLGVSDVALAPRLKRAHAWLAANRDKIVDAMSEAGNDFIGDPFNEFGGDQPDETAADKLSLEIDRITGTGEPVSLRRVYDLAKPLGLTAIDPVAGPALAFRFADRSHYDTAFEDGEDSQLDGLPETGATR